ncbi:MAG TPA: DUF1893 domain-containing protein [Clostridiales bacterium]|nr:DUF1893 domain-containing protein [Clostridiales bacterium]
MTDLELAKSALAGHTLALARDGEVVTHDGRGISPMMEFLAAGRDLRGFSAADLVVGRAAAMLFVLAGVRTVYAETMSEGARAYLLAHGVAAEYQTLTDGIRNRAGTGPCPMEAAVREVDLPEEGYRVLAETIRKMKGAS